MHYLVSVFVLLLACTPFTAHAQTPADILAPAQMEPWNGDLDGMLRRRMVRILVVPSKTFFFLNKAETLGLTAEGGREFEKWVNTRHAKPPFDIKVVFVPTRRDRISRT